MDWNRVIYIGRRAWAEMHAFHNGATSSQIRRLVVVASEERLYGLPLVSYTVFANEQDVKGSPDTYGRARRFIASYGVAVIDVPPGDAFAVHGQPPAPAPTRMEEADADAQRGMEDADKLWDDANLRGALSEQYMGGLLVKLLLLTAGGFSVATADTVFNAVAKGYTLGKADLETPPGKES